jgi:hypothetical protein
MSGFVRFVVVDRYGRCLRLFDGGGPAALFAIGWVECSDWHAAFVSREEAEAIATQVNADHRMAGATVEERLT